jgi:hypothetical protein
LPQSSFSDPELLVLRELSRQPATLQDLCARSAASRADDAVKQGN